MINPIELKAHQLMLSPFEQCQELELIPQPEQLAKNTIANYILIGSLATLTIVLIGYTIIERIKEYRKEIN